MTSRISQFDTLIREIQSKEDASVLDTSRVPAQPLSEIQITSRLRQNKKLKELLESLLLFVEGETVELEVAKRRIHNAQSLVNRSLPEELLCAIFLHCLPSDADLQDRNSDADLRDQNYHGDQTVKLASVCWKWRHLVVNMPRLWSSICCFYDTFPDLQFDYLAMQLERSQKCRLTISLRDCDARRLEKPDLLKFLRLIGPHTPRCDYLHISLPEFSDIEFMFHTMPDLNAVRHQSLYFVFDGGDEQILSPNLRNTPLFSPSKLRISCEHVPTRLPSTINHTGLTMLSIRAMWCVVGQLEFVSKCQNLVDLELSTYNEVQHNNPAPAFISVVLPHLEILRVWTKDSFDQLKNLNTPVLTTLQLCHYAIPAQERWLLTVSPDEYPLLRCFRFLECGGRYSGDIKMGPPLARFIHAFNGLEEIALEVDYIITIDALDALCGTSEYVQGHGAPKLQHLTISTRHITDEQLKSHELMERVVRSLSERPALHITLRNNEPQISHEFEALKQFPDRLSVYRQSQSFVYN